MNLSEKREALLTLLQSYESCLVAFSAGVDSATMAKAACLALGNRAVAVTSVSPSLATGEKEQAEQIAREIGIEHILVSTKEIENRSYQKNDGRRCFHCKTELYTDLAKVASEKKIATIVNGANLDDLTDYRPGMEAADNFLVKSPFIETNISKNEIRQLAHEWALPIWDKPAMPCLASRISYGLEVTRERLRMVDQAEAFLKSLGLVELRVRLHENDLARIELPQESILPFLKHQSTVKEKFQEFGFQFVTLDLAGLRSGSFNHLVTLKAP
ncbi:MAG: ATP-dependent sacrificial sulfur transferase LarE [Pirellulaceae bacterium]|nr:ATP-dependent sacrificial sulfur transferase LarE [Pirellulaceae bacterium]